MFALIQVSEMYGARRINDNRTNDLTFPVPCISEKCIEIKINFLFQYFFFVPQKVL